MGKRLISFDDLDQKSEAAENITWGLDGEWFEIDLSEVNATKFRNALEPYRNASRPTSAPRKPRNGDDSLAIREWAIRNGHVVSDKGPIPANVRQAYEKAQATNGGTATK
ncbi:Lsr2 family protein [Streptomyces turgidiscabies]|uniref:histone-like nucleoid-structuring protein Lsr2 n=1 Tax=Streptomyces TaxID=1883 RepID=UPI0005CB11D3|nr:MULTISPECIES: Lsr2 family protein [Streptomyces]MDX3494559.1 Lsr2 family protein [Streptomyces turgidiscabies]GAQ71165.1 nucleoid-associated protein Lsr2 [Streptomyces turgidiscabies]